MKNWKIWIVSKPPVSVYTRNHGNEELTFLLQLRQEEKSLSLESVAVENG